MKKISHVQSTKSEMLLNAIAVQVEFGFSDLEYKEFIYDLGVEFVKTVFPTSNANQEYCLRNKLFWNWWRLIFFSWEKDLINFLYEEKDIYDFFSESPRGFYEAEMKTLAHDSITESQFQNILKIKHGQSITA